MDINNIDRFIENLDGVYYIKTGTPDLSKEIIRYEISETIKECALESVFGTYPEYITDFFSRFNGLTFSWQHNWTAENSFTVMGNIGFSDCNSFIHNHVNTGTADLFLLDEFNDYEKTYLLPLKEDGYELVIYNSITARLTPLTLNIESYTDKAIMCCGLYFWQDFFLKNNTDKREFFDPDRFAKEFNYLFPQSKIDQFIAA